MRPRAPLLAALLALGAGCQLLTGLGSLAVQEPPGSGGAAASDSGSGASTSVASSTASATVGVTTTGSGGAPGMKCRLSVYTMTPTRFYGECKGCGKDETSWTTASAAAVAACNASSCATGCSTPKNMSDNCAYDAMTNGFWCRSICALPKYVYEATYPGYVKYSWTTAHTKAYSFCLASGCQGVCSDSTFSDDQCEYDTRIDLFICHSTCVCP